MKWGAHSLVALGATSIALGEVSRLVLPPASPITGGLFFVGGLLSSLLGAILPDIMDFVIRWAGATHRNLGTHGIPSLFVPGILILLVHWWLFAYFPALVIVVWGITFGLPLGWATHLLLDALNPSGIPLPSGRFSWDWATYDSPAGNRVLQVVGAICMLAGCLLIMNPAYPLFLPLLAALWASRWRGERVRESDLVVKVLTTENVEVVATLTGIARLWGRMGDQARAIAFRKAARTIRDLRWSLKQNHSRIVLDELPFVGKVIAGIIKATLTRGRCNYLDWLNQQYSEWLKSGKDRAKIHTTPPLRVPTAPRPNHTTIHSVLNEDTGVIT